jgi:hypothetical protein
MPEFMPIVSMPGETWPTGVSCHSHIGGGNLAMF